MGASLPQRIKSARIAAGLTQAQLAKRMRVEPITVSRWERGVFVPSPHALARLVRILGLDLSDNAA